MKPLSVRRVLLSGAVLILLFSLAIGSLNIAEAQSAPSSELTSLRQLRYAVAQERRKVCSFQIEGVVRAANRADGTLFLQDDSEADLLELDLGNQSLQPGQRVRLQGTNCAAGRSDVGIRIGQLPVVDVDGSHPAVTDSGAIFLKAGRHPFTVLWFNDIQGATLEVNYEGPGLRNRKISDSVLFRAVVDAATGVTNFLNGINFRCFEGNWDRLPDFSRLTPTKSGTIANFNINVRTRPEHVGMEFTGLVEATRDGLYTFTLKSDDGGRLLIPETPPQLTVIGTSPLASARQVGIGETLATEEQYQWSEVEGELSFIGERAGSTELELSDGDSRMRLKIRSAPGEPPIYLLHSRVRAAGICQGNYANGRMRANTLVLPDWQSLQVLDVPPESWSAFPAANVNDLGRSDFPGDKAFVRVAGKIRLPAPDTLPTLQDETNELPIELLMSPPVVDGETVQVLGRRERTGTNVVLREAIYRKESGDGTAAASPAIVLTTAAQVQRLSREEAQRGYPVKIRGVITFVAPNFASLIIHDSTRSIFVTHYDGGWKPDMPRVGEYWEINGISNPADFAPVVVLKKALRLGPGRLPDPVHPTWDQLVNGSLDAQYVELQGIVTAVQSNTITLMTRAGKIDTELMNFPRENLGSFENALVRIRGSLFAEWDRDTHRVKINGEIHIGDPSVTVDEPAPADLFDTIKKSTAELLYFDPLADAFRRVRIGGQVLQYHDGTYYVMDGTNGVRFVPKENIALQSGDTVEIVGFPQLGGPSPVLLEAVARKTGHEPLPAPRRLSESDLIQSQFDSTLVSVEGVLLEVRGNTAEPVLEIQSGLRTFAARVLSPDNTIRALEPGSRLALTGVYAGQGGNRAEGRDINSFELLLGSASGIQVLARPPWWTLERSLILVGILLGILVLALVWINLLRRQVEKRTDQLQVEIHEREQAEQERAIEKERTRIARDIHDELGYSLAQIRLLSEMTLAPDRSQSETQLNAEKISSKALEATRVMDEIVWAVDPQNDTLESLLNYVFTFASEYFSLAGIRFRIDAPTQTPHYILPTQVRHHLFMAIKEVFTNIAKHAHASEVWIRLALQGDKATFIIEDDGRGFADLAGEKAAPGANGLTNMRKRLEEIGGEFVLESAPGKGTRVKFVLPLEEAKVS